MLCVMSGCGEDLLEMGEVKIRNQKKLPQDFVDEWPGEGAIDSIRENIEVVPSGGYCINGEYWLGIGVVYHYRNDSTRHVWGSPPTLEIGMPAEFDQTQNILSDAAIASEKIFTSNEQNDVKIYVNLHEFDSVADVVTDDRHELLFLFRRGTYKASEVVSKVKRLLDR